MVAEQVQVPAAQIGPLGVIGGDQEAENVAVADVRGGRAGGQLGAAAVQEQVADRKSNETAMRRFSCSATKGGGGIGLSSRNLFLLGVVFIILTILSMNITGKL